MTSGEKKNKKLHLTTTSELHIVPLVYNDSTYICISAMIMGKQRSEKKRIARVHKIPSGTAKNIRLENCHGTISGFWREYEH